MKSEKNVEAWLSKAPAEVSSTTAQLMGLVERMRENETIYPAQDDILNALAYTAPSEVKVVILGQDPYHGPGQAMGLSFSVPSDQKFPPSLRNIFKELSADLGCGVPTSGDLSAWAQRGVLLLNTTLTVREHAAASHAKLGWQSLTTHVVEECFRLPQPIVFLAWGRHAIDLVEGAQMRQGSANNKFCLASTHPSPLSASRPAGECPAFLGSRPFSRANELLVSNGAEPVDWGCICQSSLF